MSVKHVQSLVIIRQDRTYRVMNIEAEETRAVRADEGNHYS